MDKGLPVLCEVIDHALGGISKQPARGTEEELIRMLEAPIEEEELTIEDQMAELMSKQNIFLPNPGPPGDEEDDGGQEVLV